MSTNCVHGEKGKIMSDIKIEQGVAGDEETTAYSQIITDSSDRKLSASGIHYQNLPDLLTLDVRADEASVSVTRQVLVEIITWIDSLPVK